VMNDKYAGPGFFSVGVGDISGDTIFGG